MSQLGAGCWILVELEVAMRTIHHGAYLSDTTDRRVSLVGCPHPVDAGSIVGSGVVLV